MGVKVVWVTGDWQHYLPTGRFSCAGYILAASVEEAMHSDVFELVGWGCARLPFPFLSLNLSLSLTLSFLFSPTDFM